MHLAALRYVRGEADGAEGLLRESLGQATATPRLGSALVSEVSLSLAGVLVRRGRLDEADRLAAKAARDLAGSPSEVAVALDVMALVRMGRGDLDAAVELLRRAARAAEHEPARPATRAAIALHRGLLELAVGRYAEADDQLEHALELAREAVGPDHPATIPSIDALARCRLARGRVAEAEALDATARRIAARAYGVASARVE